MIPHIGQNNLSSRTPSYSSVSLKSYHKKRDQKKKIQLRKIWREKATEMTGKGYTSLVLPSTILKYFVTIIPLNKRSPYVSIFTKERNFTILSAEEVNWSLSYMVGGREGTGHGTKWVRFQVFLSCPKKRSKSINVIKPPEQWISAHTRNTKLQPSPNI